MPKLKNGAAAFIACCVAIFWPGAFIFGFPGTLGPYWQQAFEVGRADIGKSLFFVLAGAGSFMYLTGRWQERLGFPWVTALGAVVCGGSAALLSFARGMGAVYAWAFLVGASSAFIYIPALTVAQRWYPHRRGLASGVVNMVFGLSAAVMSPLYPWLLSCMGYRAMTLTLGLIAAGIGLAAAVFIRLPRSPLPASAVPTAGTSAPASLTVRQSLKTRSFWFLWLTWALAGAAGVAMVYLANAFGVARGFSIQKAILLQTAFNLTNGAGRLVSGFASDRWGRNGTLVCIFLLEVNFNLVFTYLGGLYTIAAILIWFVRPER